MAIPLGQKAADDQAGKRHEPVRFSAAFAGGAARAADGRKALRAVLARAADVGHPPLSPTAVMDAELVISELLTNAIRHAPGPCGVVLELSGTEVSITVWDTSPREPVPRPPDEGRIGGHGLRLVNVLSHRFVTVSHALGKQVVAHVRLLPDRTQGALSGP
ncbi:ATP-binding protein [Streptomyces sp. NRRL S-1022]|uniref:ATP-binding protein n=1 Tax=Streptomyces sp. NRRL S-1022 TaxID=1463880 RepID=UPI0004C10C16|nr:ATP-binding protein [Streptomyces sp. NRRL S-1022]